jgi:hypothetical protein
MMADATKEQLESRLLGLVSVRGNLPALSSSQVRSGYFAVLSTLSKKKVLREERRWKQRDFIDLK